MSFKVVLSTKNFSEASKIEGRDEFSFIIGNKRIYCHKYISAFLSKTISQQLISDPTTNSFIIDTKLPNIDDKQQKDQICSQMTSFLQKLIFGESIELTEDDIEEFHGYLQDTKSSTNKIYSLLLLNKSIDNDELRQQIYRKLFTIIKTTEKENSKNEIESAMKKMNALRNFVNLFTSDMKGRKEDDEMINEFKNSVNHEYEKFIENASMHFYELDENVIVNMNREILEDILKSKCLKIESEDSFLNVLLKRRSFLKEKEEGKIEESRYFIEYVQFEFLREESMTKFVREICIGEIDELLWERIKARLVLPVVVGTENKRSKKQNEKANMSVFEYNSERPFEGIFGHLTNVSNGNIQTNKTIEITCSNMCCGQIENIVEYSKSDGFLHVGGNPSPRWVKFDLKGRKIQVNSYIIKLINDGFNRFIRSWKIEISDDNQNWKTIDVQSEVSALKGEGKTQIFNVEVKHQPSRFIRIISDKNNWYNDNGFSLGRIEFFGQMFQE